MSGEAGEGAVTAPSLRRRMAAFVYEGLLLFGIGLVPGAIGALFFALTGQHHPLEGFTGEAEYSGSLDDFLPYLRAAQWTGVGRQTVWGKGELSVEVVRPGD